MANRTEYECGLTRGMIKFEQTFDGSGQCTYLTLCMPHSWKHSSHAGQGSEEPDLVEDVPVYFRGVRLDDL